MEEKKTLKGFTLVELVIVLAIFSVILALVMSFIDPVSNLMKNTSIRERTAAYSDNISEYVDNSLHYAKYMYVYEGGLFKFGHPDQPASLEEVAKDLIKNNLDGAVDKKKHAIGGKVRIMKFNNAQYKGHAGQISEGVWEFTCGDSTATPAVEPIIKDVGGNYFTPTLNNVLNQEYFENYNYYYSIGYYDFKAYETAESGTFGKQNTHNSRLIQRTDTAGHDMEAKIENFPVNIVAYNKDAGSRFTDYEKDADGNPVASSAFTAFKSPSHMSTVSMALVNAMYVGKADVVDFYRFDTTDNEFKAISGTLAFNNGKYSGPDDDDAIYVAYILPYEINDSVMDLGEPIP